MAAEWCLVDQYWLNMFFYGALQCVKKKNLQIVNKSWCSTASVLKFFTAFKWQLYTEGEKIRERSFINQCGKLLAQSLRANSLKPDAASELALAARMRWEAPGEANGSAASCYGTGRASNRRSSGATGKMSGCRQQQQPGGTSGSVPGTSAGSTATANSANTGGSSANANGNGVSSRSLGSEAQLQGAQRSGHSKKRPLYNGLINPYEDKSNDFVWWVKGFQSLQQLFS